MLDRIIWFSVHRKPVIGLLIIGLIAWGSYALTQLPIDAVPDITNNQVQVITRSPAYSAQDIERMITFPVEQAMATIPHMVEMRSFSRFGLSVVTLVFDESIDVYWARQQVGERLVQIKSELPAEMGLPEIAPVTTGLGEIFQYTLAVKPGYEQQYSITELRTIQDWIVRRQLLGTTGVADVSSFGGYVKQYEVAVKPLELRSYNISLSEVYNALQNGNKNTGGAYIEKYPNVYFIRSEGIVKSVNDIENCVIRKNADGSTLLVKHVAEVKMGHATRYGAMTLNKEGETVGGIVLMLKGANSSAVIDEVKTRIAQIEKSLPEGVTIQPFLDRTKLVNGAIKTVSTNLIEGALIVIFVLVLLLGNVRAGLLVASVIPLAMLFAIGMMHVFGVSGNLMSLGAIDFGLIVDGAVIIVEATLHHLHKHKSGMMTRKQFNEEVYKAAAGIRTSAAFGEIIILIVYLPILALTGIEGKMFKPMAQTVSFAILGAFLLSLTYVPMMSALLLKQSGKMTTDWSEKWINALHRRYKPVLAKVLLKPYVFIASAVVLLIASLLLFTQLGAEFIPTLDEGDFAVETRLLPGSGLDKTIEVSQKSAEVLIDHFPEVIKVVGKIGTSEIPMDPMPLEACDLMIILKDKHEWTSAKSRDELAEKMQEQLEEHMPGVTFGFQQPIQMRFNELMTGARQDVVLKIYGEDLDQLAVYARKLGNICSKVRGAEDVYVEPIEGIEQVVIRMNRSNLMRYGIQVADVNAAIYAALAGAKAGMVFEKERSFDLVLRMDNSAKKDIAHLEQIPVSTSNGTLIPLREVADVSLEVEPNQIQRDAGKRRVIVGFNIRGRDVESTVHEVQALLDKELKMESGYTISYGGTFKNLEEARARLLIAVPVALLLIFALLYFTFQSITQALIIFTAIPLSAIGGIIALWLRDMPFSISAGIGFIALFGVSVLNGIVLIAEFNKLVKKEQLSWYEAIMKGTEVRLRPVLMTALVASLGFLPMALSTGDGAEVQKPLATVVIGGLITSTLLTLFILPVLVKQFSRFIQASVVACMVCILVYPAQAQNSQILTLNAAIEQAWQYNLLLKTAKLETQMREKQKTAWYQIPKTDFNLMYGQYNSYARNDNNITIAQTLPFSTFTGSNRAYGSALYQLSKHQYESVKNELRKNVTEIYVRINHALLTQVRYRQLDTLWQQMEERMKKRYELGDIHLLAYSSVMNQRMEIEQQLIQQQELLSQLYAQLAALVNSTSPVAIADTSVLLLPDDFIKTQITTDENPMLRYAMQSQTVAEKQKSLEWSKALPELRLGYFNQTLIGSHNVTGTEVLYDASARFQGVNIGLSVPLFFIPDKSRIQAAEIEKQKSQTLYQNMQLQLSTQLKTALANYNKYSAMLKYYNESALPLAKKTSEQSMVLMQRGEIAYPDFIVYYRQAIDIELRYYQTLLDYNLTVNELHFLSNK
jgi:cobalt-zinc-cadmium resistance protein CzcA